MMQLNIDLAAIGIEQNIIDLTLYEARLLGCELL